MAVILVVGGAGYIGSHTCKALSDAGHSPVVYDNLSSGHRDFVQWGPLIEADLADENMLFAAFTEHMPAAVMHFAAHAYVGESVSNPEKYYRNNVVFTHALLSAMLRFQVNKFIFSSSCATYGIPASLPIDEGTHQQPINPYGRTKKIVEDMLSDYDSAYGLRHVNLRYFNACGADPDGRVGESHDPETHLIPRAILAAMGVIDDFAVFGQDYPTPDGTAIRDYIHVSDLALGHVSAVNYLLNGGISESVNLGTGEGYSVSEIIRCVEDVTGNRVPYKVGSRRAGDPAELVARPAKAKDLLNFEPKYSSLESIVSSAYGWLSKHFDEAGA